MFKVIPVPNQTCLTPVLHLSSPNKAKDNTEQLTACYRYIFVFAMARQPLGGLGLLIVRGFTITLRHTTLGRTPLDEWPARRRDHLTTHNTHNRQTSMPPAGFEPKIPVSERPQTHALDRAATGIGCCRLYYIKYYLNSSCIFLQCLLSYVFQDLTFSRDTGAPAS
jgi:hypothetical protein